MTGVEWARIMVPLSGGDGDRRGAAAGVALARPFEAECLLVHAPADLADMAAWMSDGFGGGIQTSAMESLREAADEGEALARRVAENVGYERARFISLRTPVWAAIAMKGRLSDVVVFDAEAARGRSALARIFQQVVADEQRPTLIAKDGFNPGGVAAIAWDGGKEASRAMRTALPLLRRASRVVAFTAPASTERKIDPRALVDFMAARGVTLETESLAGSGDPGPLLLAAARSVGASVLVAGAYGHSRLREFVFGGTTRSLLASEGPSLFMSH